MTRVEYDVLAHQYQRRYERDRYPGIEHALDHFVRPRLNVRVLEVGCGTGHWLRHLRRLGASPVGLDKSCAMLRESRRIDRSIPVIQGIAEHLPFRDESLQRVYCINAIHHFDSARSFIERSHAVLDQTGQILIVGLDPTLSVTSWCVYDYFPSVAELDRERYPTMSDLSVLLRSMGFAQISVSVVEHIDLMIPASQALLDGRLDKGSTSQLAILSDAEYEEGMARIDAAVRQYQRRGEVLMFRTDVKLYGVVARTR